MQQHTPPVTTIVLIRHAEAADRDARGELKLCGQVDVPLTWRGRLQAEQLGLAAARLGRIDALYTSTLRRAIETVRPIAHALGIKPRRWLSLREICCGVLDGLPVAEVQQAYPDLWHANLTRVDDDFGWPGGETYRGFRNRVLRAMQRIARMHPGGRVAVVTHAGVVSQIIGSLAGQPAARWELFRPAPASLTELRWQGDVCRVLRFDDRRHLV